MSSLLQWDVPLSHHLSMLSCCERAHVRANTYVQLMVAVDTGLQYEQRKRCVKFIKGCQAHQDSHLCTHRRVYILSFPLQKFV